MVIHGIKAVRAHLAKLPAPETMTIAERRRQYERAEKVFPLPPGTSLEAVQVGAGAGEWLRTAAARTDAALLYLHGGGYVIGSPRSHRHLAAAIAAAGDVACLMPDYRLAPEHPFPAAVDDAVEAYRWLLARGIAPDRIAVAGDSAGGGLTVATLLALRERGLAAPAAAVCISPWVDLTCSGASYETRAGVDPIVTRRGVTEMARHYLGPADPRAPLASPLFGDLGGLPPLLIQVGADEVLLDDAAELAARVRAAGGEAELEVAPHMIHVWHWFLPWLDEAQAAVAKIGHFIRARLP
jgi:phosphinothricin tripeptide acetyl hydrolase